MKSNTIRRCDFCQAELPEEYYTHKNSRRGVHVYTCNDCGLIQSISTAAYTSRPAASMSCDADRASIKYTKDLVLKPHLDILNRHVNLAQINTLLDVGSNRGAFLRHVVGVNPSVTITAVETDPELVENYRSSPQVTIHTRRLEQTDVGDERYDFIYCAHTLEHFQSASAMLRKLNTALKPGGLIFYAVPNIFSLTEDSFEESFIDTHTFHFCADVLESFINGQGSEIVAKSPGDAFELTYLIRKPSRPRPEAEGTITHRETAENSRAFMRHYAEAIDFNRRRLRDVAAKLMGLAHSSKVVFWGAGRIFDGLTSVGGFDTGRIEMLVDKYLYRYMDTIDGIPIRPPEALQSKDRSIPIIVASREYASEIFAEAHQMGFLNTHPYTGFME